ncbi:hypothetical protein ACJX0J_019059, partial [Zea mays]
NLEEQINKYLDTDLWGEMLMGYFWMSISATMGCQMKEFSQLSWNAKHMWME